MIQDQGVKNMKERKKQLKRLLAVALSLVVIGGSVNLPVLTSLAEDDTDSSGATVAGTNDPSGQGTEQDTPDEPGTEPVLRKARKCRKAKI